MKIIKTMLTLCFLTGCAGTPEPPPGRGDQAGFAANPLTVPIRTRDLRDFATVEALARHVAAALGYQLIYNDPAPAEAQWIAQWPPNPAIHTREIRPAEDILAGAVHPRGRLLVDPIHKAISFDLAGEALPTGPGNPFEYAVTGDQWGYTR